MMKPSTLSEIVRPSIVAWIYLLFTVIILCDGNVGGFSIKDPYIPIMETILVTVTLAYFGSRGAEKMAKTIKGKDT